MATPVDMDTEAASLATVRHRVELLLDSDPTALRRRVAGHVELLHELALSYLRRSEAASYTPAKVAFVGIAIRALAAAGRLAVIVGASAPRPEKGD